MSQGKLISEQVISCAFEVSNILGAGFLEKVYENACTDPTLYLLSYLVQLMTYKRFEDMRKNS